MSSRFRIYHVHLKYSKNLHDKIEPSDISSLKLANNQTIPIEGKCIANIKIGNIDSDFQFLICKDIGVQCILGVDFLTNFKCILDFSSPNPQIRSQKGSINTISLPSTQISNGDLTDKPINKISFPSTQISNVDLTEQIENNTETENKNYITSSNLNKKGDKKDDLKPIEVKITTNNPLTEGKVEIPIQENLAFRTAIVYLDDISLVATDFDESLVRLKEILERLKQFNLKLSLKKCTFFANSIKFLGYIISKQGIQTDPEKINVVVKWPSPCNQKSVQRFLGMVNYYRKFIQNYAEKAKPLYKLLNKDIKFNWTEACEKSFQTLKHELTNAPILMFPNLDKNAPEFHLQTDASQNQLGAVLSQLSSDGNMHPIAYASRILKKSERNYCITKLEITALIFGVTKFRMYLIGKKFKIMTDHKALISLKHLSTLLV